VELARLRVRLGRRFDAAIVFQWGSTAADLLAALAARRRYGYENRAPGLLLSCRLGPYGAGDERAQNLELLRLAGVPSEEHDPGDSPPWARGDRDAVLRLLADRGVVDPTRLVVVHAGSDWACQQWSPERWAVLVRHLWRRYRAELVFTGTARDAEHVGRIRSLSAVPSVSLTGETSLGMLAALLSMARLCVCVDSAAYEVAQLSGVPTVVLASPTSAEPLPGTASQPIVVNRTPVPERFAIGQCQHDVGGHGCVDWKCPRAGLRLIEIGEVARAVRRTGALTPVANV
jgi:ADP-heptose:LPS heptosyltransferase